MLEESRCNDCGCVIQRGNGCARCLCSASLLIGELFLRYGTVGTLFLYVLLHLCLSPLTVLTSPFYPLEEKTEFISAAVHRKTSLPDEKNVPLEERRHRMRDIEIDQSKQIRRRHCVSLWFGCHDDATSDPETSTLSSRWFPTRSFIFLNAMMLVKCWKTFSSGHAFWFDFSKFSSIWCLFFPSATILFIQRGWLMD